MLLLWPLCLACCTALRHSAWAASVDRAHLRAAAEVWYVTFLTETYAAHAAALGKAIHDLGHRHPLVFMVEEGSELARRAGAVDAVLAELGWNARVETHPRVHFDFHSRTEGWDVAMQRIALFQLDRARVRRFVHLDADTLVRRSLDNLTETFATPVFARRMGSCQAALSLYSPQPCTNLFSAEPDHVLAHRLAKTLTEVGGNADIQTGACRSGFLCDEAAIISNTVWEMGEEQHAGGSGALKANMVAEENVDGRRFLRAMEDAYRSGLARSADAAIGGVSLLPPWDLANWDCWTQPAADDGVEGAEPHLAERLAVLHLGVPGRHVAEAVFRDPFEAPEQVAQRAAAVKAAEPTLARSPFLRSAVDALVALHTDPSVHRVVAALLGKPS